MLSDSDFHPATFRELSATSRDFKPRNNPLQMDLARFTPPGVLPRVKLP
jgi:hypothetical protein